MLHPIVRPTQIPLTCREVLRLTRCPHTRRSYLRLVGTFEHWTAALTTATVAKEAMAGSAVGMARAEAGTAEGGS